MYNEKLATIFNVRPGEGLRTVLLLIHSFFIGISLVFFETASYALFLTKFNVENLPYVYIVSAGIITVVGFIYSKFQEHLSFSKLLIFTLAFFFLSICTFYIFLELVVSEWTAAAVVVWYNVMVALVGLEFWGLAGHLLDVRQGKRLYGLIGVGQIIAEIISGFSVSLLSGIIGASGLLLISAGGMLSCLVTLIYITRTLSRELASPTDDEEKASKSLSEFFKDRYLILITISVAFSIFGYYVLDYIFYEQVEGHCPDENQIAGFLGIFAGVNGIINLLCNAFLSGRLITHYGLSIGLLAFPIALMVGIGLSAVSFFGSAGIFFWMIVGIKAFDEVVRYTIQEPTIRILYQPLPQGQQLRTQTVVEGMVEPIFTALVSAVLLVLTSVLPLNAIHLLSFMLFILITWIVTAFLMRSEYTKVLTRAITKRKLGGTSFSLNDASSKAVLEEWLKSDKAGDVIYSLNMLEELRHSKLEVSMIRLLEHREPAVRKHVLERIRARIADGISEKAAADMLERITGRLKTEKSPQVMGALLQTLCAISETEAYEEVAPYLIHEDVEVRKGALIGMLRDVGLEGVMAAGVNLRGLIDSDEPDERELAARVLGEVGIPGFSRPLSKLLEDDDMRVRKAAIVASEELKSPKLLPHLLKNLSEAKVRQAAVAAVIAFGEKIVPELEGAYDKEGESRHTRIRIIRIWGRIGGKKAIELLKRKIERAEEDIRTHILAALVSCKYQVPVRDVFRIQEQIRKEIEDATWTLSVLSDMGDYEHSSRLKDALKSDVVKNRKRIFLLLAMIYPPDPILAAQRNLGSSSSEKKAYALETLDNIISLEIKPLILRLMDDTIPLAQRHSWLTNYFPQERMSPHERLKEILRRSQKTVSSWTRACTLFTIGNIGTKEFHDIVISGLNDPDPTVRETAVWALGCLNPEDLGERLQTVVEKNREKHPRVAEFTRFVINSVAFASIHMGKGYLTRSGQYTVDLFASILRDTGERRARRCRAANILSRFKGSEARNALLESIRVEDKTVRTAALDALVKSEFDMGGKAREDLVELLRDEIRDAKDILSSIAVLLPEKYSERLVEALNQEINNNRKRSLSILTLLNGNSNGLNAINYWYILQKDKTIPGQVTDDLRVLLSTVEDRDTRKKAFTLFHQYRDSEHLRRIKKLRPLQTPENVERHLKEIAFGSSIFTLSWSRICALEMIVSLKLSCFIPQIVESTKSSDDIVRSTAVWALFKLSRREFEKHARRLKLDRHPLVARTVEQLLAEMPAPRPIKLKAITSEPELEVITPEPELGVITPEPRRYRASGG